MFYTVVEHKRYRQTSLSLSRPTYSVRVLVVSTKFHYFKTVLPASPYIIIPPGGIIIYELAGGNILKKRNVVDPSISRVGEVGKKRPICWRPVAFSHDTSYIKVDRLTTHRVISRIRVVG